VRRVKKARKYDIDETQRKLANEMTRMSQFYSVEIAGPDREVLPPTPTLKRNRVVVELDFHDLSSKLTQVLKDAECTEMQRQAKKRLTHSPSGAIQLPPLQMEKIDKPSA
jgi:hypothetical protein